MFKFRNFVIIYAALFLFFLVAGYIFISPQNLLSFYQITDAIGIFISIIAAIFIDKYLKIKNERG